MGNATKMPLSMRALVIDRPGAPDEFHLAEVPVPIVVLDELLVRVVAAGVNPIDAKTRAGKGVSAAISAYPAVLGNDFSGVVVSAPYAAFPLQPGDEVYGLGFNDAFKKPFDGGLLAERVKRLISQKKADEP